MGKRHAAEALFWLGLAAIVTAAALVRELSGNQFVGLVAIGAIAMVAGLFFMVGPRRPR